MITLTRLAGMQSADMPQRPVLPALTEASRTILVQILIHGPTSRAELARRSGLSPASLTRITKTMVEVGLLTENGAVPPIGTGRPSLPMEINVDFVHLLGVNLTRSTITMVRTDMRARLLDECSVAIDNTDPEVVVDHIVEFARAEQQKDPNLGVIGLSLAGPVSPRSDRVRRSPFLDWKNVPLAAMIRGRTGLATVVENDVRALTATEHWFGAAAGYANFGLITLGTGVGCGIVVDNRLIEGLDGGSGQVGHLPVSSSGPLCERGHRGCIRSYLSSTSIVNQVKLALDRPGLSYDDVLDLAAAKQRIAHRVVQDAGHALGFLIGTLAAITAPAKILLSGEGVGLVALVEETMHDSAAAAQHWALPAVPIEVAPFTFTEWARGAAVIALRRQVEAERDVDGG